MKRAGAALLRSLGWLVPSVFLAFPRIDGLFLAYLGVVLAGSLAIALVIDPVSFRRKDGEDRRSETRLSALLFGIFVVSALDVGRLGASGPVVAGMNPAAGAIALNAVLPDGVRGAGLALLASAYALRTLAIGTNRFFSGVLLIQADRAHCVVDRGPYRWVRHPGNLSAILIVLALPLAAGSCLALGIGALAALVVLDRTAKEDRFLRERLPGYLEYQRSVPYRLVPGVY
jgi:protein-S-isoprenylcysteine O-methyltransferase Ste14